MPLKAPPILPPAVSWTGCYLSAGGGYGMFNADSFAEDAGVAITTTSTSGGRGWLGRFGGGCDYQVAPRWVIGVFGDYDLANITGFADSGLGSGGTATDRQRGPLAAGSDIW